MNMSLGKIAAIDRSIRAKDDGRADEQNGDSNGEY